MRPRDVLPRHIYRYVDTRISKNGENSRATGLYEIRAFRHVFTKRLNGGFSIDIRSKERCIYEVFRLETDT